MLNSLGKELSKEDFLVSVLGNQHAFVIIQASNTQKPLVVKWPDLLKAILAKVPSNPGGQSGVEVQDEGSVIATLAQFLNFVGAGVTVTPNGLGVDVTIPGAAPGSAAWGSIAAGTGVGSQTDLVTYLTSNFYPLLSNPAGYVTASMLAATLLNYVTSSALTSVLGGYVPTSRILTINGVAQDLSTDRTWTIPIVPPESVYPYIKNQYFMSLDMSCGQYANNLLFLGGNLKNQVIVVNTQTGDSVITTSFDRPIAASKITSLGTPESWITPNTSVTTVCRHNLTTGAFIAITALTGVVTNAQNSRFVDFNSTKTIGYNLTQIYNVNPSTFVTTNLTTHGLGSFCMSALNTNGASAQNGVLMLGGSNGIVLYDCNTSTITLSATTLGGIIGPVQDIIYIPSLDTYAVYTTLSGNQRIVYLQVTGATTFTQTLSIANLSNFNVSLTYPTSQVRFKMFADVSINELFVMVNNRLSVFNLTTGVLLKSDLYSSFGAGNFPIVADIDTSNNRLFFSTGGTSPSTVFELIYT